MLFSSEFRTEEHRPQWSMKIRKKEFAMSAKKARQIRGVEAENLLVRFDGEEKPVRIFDSSTKDGSSLSFHELRAVHKFIGGRAIKDSSGKPTGNPTKRQLVEAIRDELLDPTFDDREFGSDLVHLVNANGEADGDGEEAGDAGDGDGTDGEGETDGEGTDGSDGDGESDGDGGDESDGDADGDSDGESDGDGEGDESDSDSEADGESDGDGEEGDSDSESDSESESEEEEQRELSPIEEQIKDMIDEFGGDSDLDEDRVREIAREEDEVLETSILNTIDKTIDRVTERAEEAAEKVIANYVSQPVQINLDTVKVAEFGEGESTHEVFGSVLRIMQANQGDDVEGTIRAERTHGWIYGPAGTGKSYVVKQAAKALGLEFESMSVGPTDTYSKMFGFVDANSNYVTTPIREAVEHGRVCLIDEVDNGSPDVNNSLNMLLALSVGDTMSFPDGPVRVSEGFVAFCTANTRGNGSDGMYKRQVQDGAFKDRFVYLEMGIDEVLEEQINSAMFVDEDRVNDAGENIRDAQLEMIQYIRKARRAIAIRRQSNIMVSPRATKNAVHMLAMGFSVEETRAGAVWKGAEESVVRQLLETMDDHFGEGHLAPERNVI